MNIDYSELNRIDLNLLIAFDVLHAECNVTRAAERLGIGQSSMSHSLNRLRKLFGDELFTRCPDGVRPTPRAMALAPAVRSALGIIQQNLLHDGVFDASQADRTFILGMPDSIEVPLLPRLLALLARDAPKIKIRIRAIDRFDVLEQLNHDRLHLGIAGLLTEGGTQHKRRKLYATGYLCLFDPVHLNIDTPVMLEDYVGVPHVLGSPRGDAHGVVDDALAIKGLKRNIAVVTPHFAAVPFMLKSARLISTVPERPARIFARQFDLATSPVPLPLPESDVSMIWHSSYDKDPAHHWLREVIVKLTATL
ncbi:LysR family transcriptional regulator [Rhizobium leguminosarum]|nr:LysR family transcriptional regulator [Rhizobium leguminosarum]